MQAEDYIIRALDKQDKELVLIQAHLLHIQVQLAGLKVKASLWGALAGTIPGIVAALYFLVK